MDVLMQSPCEYLENLARLARVRSPERSEGIAPKECLWHNPGTELEQSSNEYTSSLSEFPELWHFGLGEFIG